VDATRRGDGVIAGIEPRTVETWFAQHVPEARAPFDYEVIAGGHSNLTVAVSDVGGRRWVLRRPPLAQRLATAHDVGREYRVIAALQDTQVPVPPAVGLCEDEQVIGQPSYVMEFVDGHVLHDREAVEHHLPDEVRRRAADRLVDVLVELHAIDPDAVGLGNLGRKEGYLQRQLRRWSRQWEQSRTRELPAIERVHERLVAEAPEQGPATIVHGDFRFGNCLTTSAGEIAAVLDWELCTLGDPLADLGWFLHYWDEPDDVRAGAVGQPSTADGFPTRAEVVRWYGERSGRDVRQIDYYRAFAAWRSACIAEGVYSRYLQGALGDPPADLEVYRDAVEHNAVRAEELLTT
jgi:aminoglycoside phosphotransferase (APT) family kinase protein